MIRRILQSEMESRLRPQKVLLLLGARRVGKTVLLKEILKDFAGKSLLLNGESQDSIQMLSERTVANYQRLFSGTELLAIDEAQHIPDIGKILKLIVDEVPNIRVIATGSSAFDLKNVVGEPLVGRSIHFQLNSLSAEEILSTMSPVEFIQRQKFHLVYGHYPEILSIPDEKSCQEYLSDIVDAYLLRDILMVDGIKHAQKMYDLLRLIAYQVGSEVSYDELGKQLSMSPNTVERYLDLLQKVYVLYRLGGYAHNPRKEVSKAKKWYFYDIGIRNAILRDYRPYDLRQDIEHGALWENYVISDRLKRNHNYRLNHEFYFWRTYNQQEIDLLEVDGTQICAMEMKAGKKTPSVPKSFANDYPDADYLVVNPDNFLDICQTSSP